MSVESNILFILLGFLGLSIIIFPRQYSDLMRVWYAQDTAPNQLIIRAMGATFLLIVALLYMDFS